MKKPILIWMFCTTFGGCGGIDKDLPYTTASTNASATNEEGSTETDSEAVCGNAMLEPGESCDGNCPTTCGAPDACTVAELVGDPESCNVVCTEQSVTSCTSDDGCCPAGCDAATDSDCGSRRTNVEQPDQQCADDDGVCSADCDSSNDSDCRCIPQTCSELGVECGRADDSCGGELDCGTCSGGDSALTGERHQLCAAMQNCAGTLECMPTALLIIGKCSQRCSTTADCRSGEVCDAFGSCSIYCDAADMCPGDLECMHQINLCNAGTAGAG